MSDRNQVVEQPVVLDDDDEGIAIVKQIAAGIPPSDDEGPGPSDQIEDLKKRIKTLETEIKESTEAPSDDKMDIDGPSKQPQPCGGVYPPVESTGSKKETAIGDDDKMDIDGPSKQPQPCGGVYLPVESAESKKETTSSDAPSNGGDKTNINGLSKQPLCSGGSYLPVKSVEPNKEPAIGDDDDDEDEDDDAHSFNPNLSIQQNLAKKRKMAVKDGYHMITYADYFSYNHGLHYKSGDGKTWKDYRNELETVVRNHKKIAVLTRKPKGNGCFMWYFEARDRTVDKLVRFETPTREKLREAYGIGLSLVTARDEAIKEEINSRTAETDEWFGLQKRKLHARAVVAARKREANDEVMKELEDVKKNNDENNNDENNNDETTSRSTDKLVF